MNRGTLVLGIGNVLMGDEGIGTRVASRLAAKQWPDDVTVIDGGTGGFHLLDYLREYDPVIIVDAAMDGQPAGTISVLHPRYASDFPRALTAHDIGLRDLIETAQLLGPLPSITLVTISVDSIQPMTTVLSPEVESAIPFAVVLVRSIVTDGVTAHA